VGFCYDNLRTLAPAVSNSSFISILARIQKISAVPTTSCVLCGRRTLRRTERGRKKLVVARLRGATPNRTELRLIRISLFFSQPVPIAVSPTIGSRAVILLLSSFDQQSRGARSSFHVLFSHPRQVLPSSRFAGAKPDRYLSRGFPRYFAVAKIKCVM